MSRRLRPVLLSALAVVLLGAAYTAGVVQGETAKTAVREPLAQVNDPTGGKGRTLGLTRVTVPAGAQLALHHHPGTQIASIQGGTLTYTVVKGRATVYSGPSDTAKVARVLRAGQTYAIRTGQWIVEQPSEIHRAANRGTKPVVILLATLFPIGAPPSIPN